MEQIRPSVHQVLLTRRDSHSQPGTRSDAYRVALAIEGGGNRAAYSAGMTLALDELGFTNAIDAVYGTSGGALNGAWLLTGEAQQWLPSWGWQSVADARVSDPRRLLRGGPLVDIGVLVRHVYERITPMNFAAILDSPISFHPIATDAKTGHSADLEPFIDGRDALQTALCATTSIPLLAGRPVRLGGRLWLDGGLSEPIPYRTALEHGATHVLVLRTRRDDQTVDSSVAEQIVLAPYFAAFARGAGDSHRSRHVGYRGDDDRLGAPDEPDGARLMQIRPPVGAPDVARLSRDLDLIAEAIRIGRSALIAAMEVTSQP